METKAEPRNEKGQTLAEFLAAYDENKYRRPSVTVDMVVFTLNERGELCVMLIRRRNHPFIGRWALPGGFVEMDEELSAAAARELQEETHCTLPEAHLRTALRGQRIFDHPQRSLRGRVITQAYFFDLGQEPLPEVRGGDDAAHAEWLPQQQLGAMQDQFHDDHWHILDQFLDLSPAIHGGPQA